MKVAAILLAAGRSRRMGPEHKLTMPFEGQPLVCHAADALLVSGATEIVVVTGHESTRTRDALAPRPLRFAHNADAPRGMGTSIACGVASVAADDLDGVLVCLGDMPRISAPLVDRLIAEFEHADQIIVPVHAGRRGHPVLFGADHFPALEALDSDSGAREVLAASRMRVIEVAWHDSAIHRDFDRPEDFD